MTQESEQATVAPDPDEILRRVMSAVEDMFRLSEEQLCGMMNDAVFEGGCVGDSLARMIGLVINEKHALAKAGG